MRIENTKKSEKNIEDCNIRKKMGILKTSEGGKSLLPVPDWKTAFAGTGMLLFAFGNTDKVIWNWHRVFSGSVRISISSGRLAERMMAECLEETLLAQYEYGMLLFVLLVEGLPGAWMPKSERQKRIKEEIRPLITRVDQKDCRYGKKRQE